MGVATYQKGDKNTVDYTAGADIVVDQVLVIGDSIGIAQTAISNGDVGAVSLDGVYKFPKLSAADISQGDTVDWDASAATGSGEVDDNAMTPAAGDVSDFGVALESAGAGVLWVDVQLLPGRGTAA